MRANPIINTSVTKAHWFCRLTEVLRLIGILRKFNIGIRDVPNSEWDKIEEMKKDIDEGYRTIDDKPDKC